jgi:hypothetical protein
MELHDGRQSYDPGFYAAEDNADHAAVCLAIIEGLAAFRSERRERCEFLTRCLAEYLSGEDLKIDQAMQTVRDVAIDGLFEHLDEQLDARNAVLSLLRKYKQRCEWFNRMRLRDVASNGFEGRTGERALALDLQAYLLDQSVEFFVEPTSASGQSDVVLRDADRRYIVVDAKYMKPGEKPSSIRSKLASGFHQVARYCEDYNESAGYLVCFNDTTFRLRPELDVSDTWEYLRVGGKVIYYVIVTIADLPSASKAGKPEELSVLKSELVDAVLDESSPLET